MSALGKLVIPSLPLDARMPKFPLRHYGGFWLLEGFLLGVPALPSHFQPRPSDVLLASFPKSGTTWLKALAFATRNRAAHPPRARDHPLRHLNPHTCVTYMELEFKRPVPESGDVLAALPSPRMLGTHLPYYLLPPRVMAQVSACRVVYICRDPKDALVTWWMHVTKAMVAADTPQPPYTIDEAFQPFCGGRCPYGPHWDHVAAYWPESRRRPETVLFLRYEEMLRDTVGQVKKLAEFMGCGFSAEEEAAGVVQDIVELCSLDSLKNMVVNKNTLIGPTPVEAIFRKGVAGDWSNYISRRLLLLSIAIVLLWLVQHGFYPVPQL